MVTANLPARDSGESNDSDNYCTCANKVDNGVQFTNVMCGIILTKIVRVCTLHIKP